MNRETWFGMPSRRGEREAACGRCGYHEEYYEGEWVCLCDTSEKYLQHTAFRDGCAEFERR